MAAIIRILFVAVFCVAMYNAEDLYVGTTSGTAAYLQSVKLSSIPLKTRVKNVFYNSNATRPIKGVSAIDLDKSNAIATITAGGVGTTYVNVRIKSSRGEGLNYVVQVYV